jgi:hypothetical protein
MVVSTGFAGAGQDMAQIKTSHAITIILVRWILAISGRAKVAQVGVLWN